MGSGAPEGKEGIDIPDSRQTLGRKAGFSMFALAKWMIIALVLFTSLLGIQAALNVYGFCRDEMGVLSEKEILERASEEAYRRYPPRNYEVSVPVHNPIEYESLSDFLAANPECCEIVSVADLADPRQGLEVPFEYSLFGVNLAVVRVTYRVESDPNPRASSRGAPNGVYVDYLRVTNCGYVTNRI